MKYVNIFPCLLVLAGWVAGHSQSGFNYQAVLRQGDGILANQNLSVRFTILDKSGNVLYSETDPASTNAYGLVNVVIGDNAPASFDAIKWADGGHSVHVEVDTGGGFLDFGVVQFEHVPYAKVATGMHLEDLGGIDTEGALPGDVLLFNGNGWEAGPEQQFLTLVGSTLSISGGNSVDLNLPVGDDWGFQVAETNPTLSGNGTSGSPLGLARQGAQLDEVLKWDGSEWSPGAESNASLGGFPVNVNNPANGDVLTYDGGEWVNAEAPGYWSLNGGTIYSDYPISVPAAQTDGLVIAGYDPGYDASIVANGAVNIDATGITVRCGGDEALWYNDDYFSWGFGGNYNFFARPITVGDLNFDGYGISLPLSGGNISFGIAQEWIQASASRFKENVRPLDHALETVLRLRGVSYDWKKAYGGARDQGFIAEEVREVIPDAVHLNDRGEAVGVAYSDIIPYLVEAIKEQQARIDAQQALIDQLTARLEAIERSTGIQETNRR